MKGKGGGGGEQSVEASPQSLLDKIIRECGTSDKSPEMFDYPARIGKF